MMVKVSPSRTSDRPMASQYGAEPLLREALADDGNLRDSFGSNVRPATGGVPSTEKRLQSAPTVMTRSISSPART